MNKDVEMAYEMIIRFAVTDNKDKELLKMLLNNLYAKAQVQGMKDAKRIW